MQNQAPSCPVPQDLAPTVKTSLPSLDDVKDPEEKVSRLGKTVSGAMFTYVKILD